MNLDHIKSIPLDQVLSHYGVELKGSYPQFKGSCPVPSHPQSQHRDPFSVNLEKRKFFCHDSKCKGNRGGDVIDLVGLIEDVDVRGACRKLSETFLGNQNAPQKRDALGEV